MPANDRQAEIARRLQNRSGVVVQGPPGTGKTHTIANLIGQYLADGKSVLVTSHAAKALRVVREQIPEALRPLCVSVLEDDLAGRSQFKQSVRDISANLTLRRPVDEVAQATQCRQACLSQLRRARHQLRCVIDAEYEPIVVGGESIAPADAARFVAAQVTRDGWIPSPVQEGEPAPLSDTEVEDLYATNHLSTVDEEELRNGLPDAAWRLTPAAFAGYLAELRDIHALAAPDATVWNGGPALSSVDCLNDVERAVHQALSHLDRPDWLLQVIEDSRSDGTAAPWHNLLAIAAEAVSKAVDFRDTELEHLPGLAATPVEDQLQILTAVLDYVNSGGSHQGIYFKLRHRGWSSLLERVSVNDRRPRTVAELHALHAMAANEQRLTALRRRWERQVTALGGPAPENFGSRVETVYEQYCEQIRANLFWTRDCWAPVEEQMRRVGLDWNMCLARIVPVEGPLGQLRRTRSALKDVVLGEIAAMRRAIRRRMIEELLDSQTDSLASSKAASVFELAEAVRTRDEVRYARQYESLDELRALNPVFSRRRELLTRLSRSAPSWAAAVFTRTPPHDALLPPGRANEAWRWRQQHDELGRRARLSLPQIQQELDDLTRNLQARTVDLIYKSAWAAQRQRMADRPVACQSLQLLAQAIDRAAGKGVQASRARASIPHLMAECRGAVPAWIMPLSRVAEHFDMASTRFDLVIIDEASQATLEGLVAMYLARKIVVVGDDEQVSPDAVGARLEGVDSLVSAYLYDLPGGSLFDFNYSLYDFATARFGTPIRLREHFRCAPEIIQFSNALSYNFEIEPLRDMSRCALRPHVIPYRVSGFRDPGSKENAEEAQTIASLVAAMCEIPEYANATIGVITLLGGEQAELIDRILRNRIAPREYERRRIVCGNASQFQGDERDVILLSMVDSPNENGGPLTLMQAGARDMYKKRYNVAASRAKDQLWVVHSLNPDTDLQPADLRYRLLQHARNPHALMDRMHKVAAKADSEFERLVAARLISLGYNVIPQWKVGPFAIDLVVQGHDAKLAVECDGDRVHTAENREYDLRRQEVLERCGWTFVRVRSTQFFRNPERALQPVLDKLNEMGITPVIDAGEAPPPGPSPADAVIRRAAEIRREWAEAREDAPPDSDRDSKDSEIRNAIHDALADRGCKREELFAAARTALGFQRLGARLRQRIVAVLNSEIAAGRIRVVGRLLERPPHAQDAKSASAGVQGAQ
ncbi:MAG: AAA domain-containing protein [Bryobacteraceae bacterium]|nr:AAA domain-containing protein [Bryobacteraceae bacterium]